MNTTTECGFTLKRVRDMTRTYNQLQDPKKENKFERQNVGSYLHQL